MRPWNAILMTAVLAPTFGFIVVTVSSALGLGILSVLL